ncbi:MAG: dTDP-4-dehydrorhamnose 3,5-epimerase [Chloroflexota bacterium]|nr:dTDP-4-dehydrorhamnose 3,5-epimerase [Chloroflexota bacterium]
MNVVATDLPGVVIVEPRVFRDDRGYFLETWNEATYAGAGLPTRFVQDNLSCSKRGVIRALHYQHPNPQGKLVSVLQGEVFDVAVDIRVGSPTYRRWVGVTLSAENQRRFYVPEGFAHGFAVTSESALFAYKCTEFYRPEAEGRVRWDDPDLGISWPVTAPVLAPKDATAPLLRDVPPERLPRYGVDG